MRERVVVTGVGVVSPLGARAAFWEGLTAGASGIAPGTAEDAAGAADTPPNAAGAPRLEARARDWSARDHVRPALLRRMDRCSQMVVSAARMALADAGLALEGAAAESAGVVVGTAFGNLSESEDFLRGVFTKGPGLANPLTFPNLVLNAPAGYVAIDLGLRGPNLTAVRGEASGEAALALAWDTIVSGQADVLLAGGVDELSPVLRRMYADVGVLSPGRHGGEEWSSPFDRERNGFVMGEGAAMLVLETRTHAVARGARVYAELVGHVSESLPASPHDWPAAAAGAAPDLGRALAELGFRASASGAEPRPSTLVLSCANSTPRLDALEAVRLAALLGPAPRDAVVTSLKGAIGEFGAAGALAAAAAVLAIVHGDVPRLGALRARDAENRLPLARPDAPPPALGIDEALVTTVARGGGGVSLLFQRP